MNDVMKIIERFRGKQVREGLKWKGMVEALGIPKEKVWKASEKIIKDKKVCLFILIRYNGNSGKIH